MPMLHARRKPDHIAWPHLDRSTFALDPAEARRDDQRLTERWVCQAVRASFMGVAALLCY